MKLFHPLFQSLLSFPAIVTAASIPRLLGPSSITRRHLTSYHIARELGSLLSSGTTIFGRNDSNFASATARWNEYSPPKFQVVVEPTQQSDISIIVTYCNENSIEFLAVNRGHGSSQTLGSFDGLQINMVNFNSITVQPSGRSAWFEGGVYDGQATDYLWDLGYVTTTGSCDCVGLMGAGLGGGHGRHEGIYGMVSDNLLQLNVVLGNGSAIVVNSTSHSDLLWGMKGAGHNFGIVTSFEMNIFPRGPDTWHYHNYIWLGDKLDAVFNALNDLQGNGTTPVNMTINFGNFYMNTTLSVEEPIISWTFAYRGSASEAEQYLTGFNAIEAAYDAFGDLPYPEVSHMQSTGVDDYICQDGNTRITSTAGLQVYNVTAEALIFESFKQRVASSPALAAGCGILHEGYSTEAVDAIDPASSAYPFRSDHHLMLFDLVLAPGNATLEQEAWEWALEVRDLWNAGQPGRPVDAYVNYANGYETVEQWYGHEPWRLEKLRSLKASYDPENRFRYYNPIA